MTGAIHSTDDLTWSAASWLFYWVLEAVASQVVDAELARKLRELSEHHVGWLYLRDYSLMEQEQFLGALCASLLPAAVRDYPPNTPEGRPPFNHLRALVKLFCTETNSEVSTTPFRAPVGAPAPLVGSQEFHSIVSPDDLSWRASPDLYRWVINAVASQVTEPALAAKLRELIAVEPRTLDLRVCPGAEREQILTVLRTSLLETARRELPPEKTGSPAAVSQGAINHLRVLVKLFCT